MADKYTGIFAEALLETDFDSTAFNAISVVKDVPVTLTYRVLPANQLAFGNGSNSLNGVRTARIFQIKICDEAGSEIPCKFRLVYEDANRVRSSVLRSDITDNVSGAVTTPNQFNYLAETATRIGAYSYITLVLTPKATSTGHTFDISKSKIYIPVTRYTLANASGN